MKALRVAGVPASVHMSPIIPFLDDVEAIMELMGSATQSGAQCIMRACSEWPIDIMR